MGLTREFWMNLRASSQILGTGDIDNVMTYDQVLDQAYGYINKIYIDQQDTISLMSQRDLKDFNAKLISDFVATKKPLVSGFITGNKAEFTRLVQTLKDDITDWGPISQAMENPAITEIQINDYMSIFAEENGETRLLTDKLTGKPVTFKSALDALKICNKLLKFSEVSLSRTMAIQGGMTLDGYRVAAVDPSATAPDKGDLALPVKSPAAVIRKFSKSKLNLNNLIAYKSMTTEIAEYVRRIPQASLTTVVAGATGSGKTVFLQAFTDERPREKRTFIIEDQSELNARQRGADGIDQSNTVQFEARPTPPNTTSVAMSYPTFENLIIQALRMSPRLFILGEIRTNSVINQAVTAANTGHPFYTTIHAEDVEDTITRIAMAVASETPSIPYEVILDIVCKNITFIISQQKLDDGSRKMLQLAEVLGTKVVDGRTRPDINMLFEFRGDGEGIHEDGKIHGDYYQVGRISPKLKAKLSLKKLTKNDLEILCGGPNPGEPPIKGKFDPIDL